MRTADRLLAALLSIATLVSTTLVLVVAGFVAWEATEAMNKIGLQPFFTSDRWLPTLGDEAQFNVKPMLVASLLITLGAISLAAPVGVLVALCECYYVPRRLAGVLRAAVELLNGIPSVVFGYWGLVVLVPLINRLESPGQSLLAGILVLAIMIVPTVILSASAAIRAVPAELARAATALGMGRGALIWHLVLPVARRGIVAGIVLGMCRAVGETMAVLMVCGNVVQLPASLLDPVRTVTANIALEMGYATADHRAALFVTALLLMLAVAVSLIPLQLLLPGKSDG